MHPSKHTAPASSHTHGNSHSAQLVHAWWCWVLAVGILRQSLSTLTDIKLASVNVLVSIAVQSSITYTYKVCCHTSELHQLPEVLFPPTIEELRRIFHFVSLMSSQHRVWSDMIRHQFASVECQFPCNLMNRIWRTIPAHDQLLVSHPHPVGSIGMRPTICKPPCMAN